MEKTHTGGLLYASFLCNYFTFPPSLPNLLTQITTDITISTTPTPRNNKQGTTFIRGQPFVALWEGVTMYLTEATVVSFIKSAALSMEGNPSAYLMFDYIVFEDQTATNMTSNSFGSQVRLKEKWTCYLPRDIENWMKINNINGLKVVDWSSASGSAVVLLAASK